MNGSAGTAPGVLACHDWLDAPTQPWLVLLHGWGTDSRAWDGCRGWARQYRIRRIDLPGFGASAALPWPDTDTLLQQLEAVLPPRCTLLGWSMGGQVATLLAARCPARIERLVTLASNPHFLARADWPGMDDATAQAFHTLMRDKGSAGLKRFAMLVARGDVRERQVMETLRDSAALPPSQTAAAAPNESALLHSLDALESLDTRAALRALPMPVTHILGAADQLVPVALAQALRRDCPQHTVRVLPGLAHAPFASDATAVLEALQPAAAKRRVASAFSAAAAGYDSAAALQRDIIAQLLQALPLLQGQVLDLGCGTGALAAGLQARYPALRVTGCDIAEGMLAQARLRGIEAVPGDAEALPFAAGSFDAVLSTSVLQWCDAPTVLAEVQRVLKPGGLFAFATFGERTLCELRAAFARLDDAAHINRFASLAQWQQWSAGWQVRALDSRVLPCDYPDVMALLRTLKTIGAQSLQAPRRSGLSGRRYWQRLAAAYAPRQADGRCTASWEVVQGLLVKPS